jgi:truncated hemoglobin YjbI
VSDLSSIGGEAAVQAHVRALVARFASDFIIGYLFEGRDLERVIRHEVEHAVEHLGGPRRYTGRPLALAHRPLRINRGHFRRRLAILRTVLGERGVDPEIIDRWIAAEARLEAAIVDGTDCAPPAIATSRTDPGDALG